MNLIAMIVAILAGAAGAGVWGALAHYAQVEVGYVAWGIGLMVGLAAHKCGAQGQFAGVFCAFVVLLSILGGKMLALELQLNGAFHGGVMQEIFETRRRDADGLTRVALADDQAVRDYMLEYEYTDKESAADISDQELQVFRDETAAGLQEFAQQNPDFEAWKTSEEAQAFQDAVSANIDRFELLKSTLGPIDLIFGLLGISTAYRLGVAAPPEASPPPDTMT